MDEKTTRDSQRLAAFLEEHNCQDVVVMPLENCSWTDCFVIGTVNSVGHLKGVVHQIWDLVNELGLTVNNRHKNPGEDGWTLIDLGNIVVHLMSRELRDFYSLEKLWVATGRTEEEDQ